jgi:hypothetical protein
MQSGPTINATRAARLALVAVSLTALSIAAFAIFTYSASHPKSPAFVSTAAIWTTFVGAPLSLLLSVLALNARARCLNPRPKMPVVALWVSAPVVVGAVLLGLLMLFLEGLGHMH